jgi:hypothetical protein
MSPIKRPDVDELIQLRLIDFDDAETDPAPGVYITPVEAQRISETACQALEALPNKPGWYDQYIELRRLGWSWRVAAYIAWAALPKRSRWPRTQHELATEVLGLTSARQIGTWREKNPVIGEAIALLQAAPLYEHRADVLEALVDSASNPDYKHHGDRELYLRMIGDYVPSIKVEEKRTISEDSLAGQDEETLRRIAARKTIEASDGEAED